MFWTERRTAIHIKLSLQELNRLRFFRPTLRYFSVMSAEKQRIVVCYHCPCTDGAFSALSAWMRYGRDATVDLRFVPHYVYKPLDMSSEVFTPESTVYFMDYCGAPGVISSLSAKVKKLILLDHHKTAAEEVEKMKEAKTVPENAELVLDMNRSGATISYDYFQPWKYWSVDESKTGEAGQEATKAALDRVYKLVEDNDLWRHVIPGSKDFAAGIHAAGIEPDFSKNPKLFEQLVEIVRDPSPIFRKGEVAREEEAKACEEACKQSFVINLGGPGSEYGQCLAAQPTNPGLRSPIGNALAKYSKEKGLRAISALFYVELEMPDTTTVWKVSLRSIGAEDTSVISKAFGGGGHLNASSFVISRDAFEKWKA